MAAKAEQEAERWGRKWIEERYGPISMETRTVRIAAVRVINVVAIGIGFSEEEALASLKADLQGNSFVKASTQ